MGVTNYTLLKEDSSRQVSESLAKLMHATIDSTAAAAQLTQPAATDSLHFATIVAEKKTPGAGINADSASTKKEPPPVKKENTGTPAPVTGTPSPVPAQKNTASTPEVLPPDESDTRLLNASKTEKPSAKKPVSKNNDDILQDDGAANGFNTGIKKNTKKKNR